MNSALSDVKTWYVEEADCEKQTKFGRVQQTRRWKTYSRLAANATAAVASGRKQLR